MEQEQDFNFLIGIPSPSSIEVLKIAGALARCASVKDDSRRTTLLTVLGFDYPDLICLIPSANNPWDAAINITSTCLNHPPSFKSFINIIARFEAQSIQFQEFLSTLEYIFLHPYPAYQREFVLLFRLVQNIYISEDNLWKMYDIVKPIQRSFFSIPYENEFLLFYLLHDLKATLSESRTINPLLQFIRLLGAQVDEEKRNALEAWRERFVQLTGAIDTDVPKTGQLTRAVRQRAPNTSYLLMTIDPSKFEQKKFYVQAWFLSPLPKRKLAAKHYALLTTGKKPSALDEQERFLSLFPREKSVVSKHYERLDTGNELSTLDEIELLLNQLANQCLARIRAMRGSGLMIELFLRFPYLHHPTCDAHSWKISKGFGLTKPVSSVYPLVIRSLDRLDCEIEIAFDEWEQSWNGLAQLKFLSNWHFLQHKAFEEELYLEKNACLAFLEIPPLMEENSPSPNGHIFKQMMSAGVSLALWPHARVDLTEEQFQEAYKELLGECHLANIPEVLWEKRKNNPTHLAKELTLFYDNPYRRPPIHDAEGPELY